VGKVRDARLFVIATEDRYAPKQYFGFFSNSRIHVEVLETPHGEGADPRRVLNRLISYEEQFQIGADDQLWVLLDTDHWITEENRHGITQAILEARQRKYFTAVSRPCFDLWLLLHHESVAVGTNFALCKEVAVKIRARVGEFNKTNLKKEHYSLPQVHDAIARAKILEPAEQGLWPETTATRVYLLVEELKKLGLFPTEA
jgi:hypothetical protein